LLYKIKCNTCRGGVSPPVKRFAQALAGRETLPLRTNRMFSQKDKNIKPKRKIILIAI
jgi:hypothetical protein